MLLRIHVRCLEKMFCQETVVKTPLFLREYTLSKDKGLINFWALISTSSPINTQYTTH